MKTANHATHKAKRSKTERDFHPTVFSDGKLGRINYTVNAANTAATPNVTFEYNDLLGRLTQMTDGTGITHYQYHPHQPGLPGAGRLAQVDGPLLNDEITYAYDGNGRLQSRDIYGSTEAYGYNAKGQLDQAPSNWAIFRVRNFSENGTQGGVTCPRNSTRPSKSSRC